MCSYDLTYKEALEHGLRPRKGDYRAGWEQASRWERLVATLHHWYTMLTSPGRKYLSANTFHCEHVVVGRGVPRCSNCGAPIGSCEHVGTRGGSIDA